MQSSLRAVRLATPRLSKELSRGYATDAAFKLKGQAAKDHANDGGKGHTHTGTQKCILPDCDSKKCPGLCDQAAGLQIDGHNTHKPPIGRFCRFVASEDVNGDPRPQYYVPSNTKNEMTEQEKQNYGKQIKPDSAAEAFMQKYKDKYE